MGSHSDAQRLQTACQELLKKEDAFAGFLRRKTVLHKLCEGGFAEQVTARIAWKRRYFVVSDGFLYNYKNETDSRPAKVIDLCSFQRVERDERLKVKGVPWPLKISSDIPNVKVLNFGATSEQELKKWIEAVKKGIEEAKQSGRHPVVSEKADDRSKTRNAPPRRKPQHSSEEDDNELYTSRPDQENEIDEYNSGSDYSSIDGDSKATGNAQVETPASAQYAKPLPQPHGRKKDNPKCSTETPETSRQVKALPPPHGRKNDPSRGIKTERQLPSSGRNSQTDSNREPPLVPRKTEDTVVNKKPTPQGKPPHKERRLPIEELVAEPDDIVSEATWTGTSEEGIAIMKSIEEEGVFMLRESTKGNGELTLQVISDDAVRKYRITKEGEKYRMIGGGVFDSMAELLSFYQNNKIPNRTTKLTKPYSKVYKADA